MERDIDKRQTVEEAAHFFAESRSSGSAFPAYYHGFIAGAEWQAKQFPWISTKDKLPDDEDLVITGCWCTDYFKYLQQGWYCRECNEWYDTNYHFFVKNFHLIHKLFISWFVLLSSRAKKCTAERHIRIFPSCVA